MVNRKINSPRPRAGKNLKIVCLGGGIGTSNLIRGLKDYYSNITSVTSMADDGGSSGRLRKAYNIMPPGDMVTCISAFVADKNKELAELLTYRFPGQSRENKAIDAHKLGNLIMLAEILRTKDIYKAIDAVKRMFGVTADILPASDTRTHLSAITKDGRRLHSEDALTLGKYAIPYGLKKIYLTPKNPPVNFRVTKALDNADVIISGPGDLFTDQLPVLIIPEIKKRLLKSNCRKIFVLNIANKPYETKGFSVTDIMNVIKDHLGIIPFDTIIINNNFSLDVPKVHKEYKYIKLKEEEKLELKEYKIVEKNLVSKDFPIYHDSKKLAKAVIENI